MAILFLAHRAPRAPDRGDRIRSFHILQHLAQRHDVHLVALDESAAPLSGALAERLASAMIVRRDSSRFGAVVSALASGLPVSLAAWDSAEARAAVERVMRAAPIAAAYAFSSQMAPYLPAGVPALMDFGDVDSAKFAALGEATRGPLRRLYAREARLLGGFERAVASRVAASIFVTEAEAAVFRRGGGRGRIIAIENGVDTVSYDPAAVPPQRFGRPAIVFTGQMDYAPNVEAVRWFATEMLPRLKAHHQDTLFVIVGRAPTAAVRALAGPDVVVTGEVDDPRSWLAGAAVAVAPLKLARGVQNKVLEAMAMARPVVATPAAAEGIDHGGTIRIGVDATQFAAAVAALLADRGMAEALGAAARDRAIRRFGWAPALAPLDALIDEVALTRLAA